MERDLDDELLEEFEELEAAVKSNKLKQTEKLPDEASHISQELLQGDKTEAKKKETEKLEEETADIIDNCAELLLSLGKDRESVKRVREWVENHVNHTEVIKKMFVEHSLSVGLDSDARLGLLFCIHDIFMKVKRKMHIWKEDLDTIVPRCIRGQDKKYRKTVHRIFEIWESKRIVSHADQKRWKAVYGKDFEEDGNRPPLPVWESTSTFAGSPSLQKSVAEDDDDMLEDMQQSASRETLFHDDDYDNILDDSKLELLVAEKEHLTLRLDGCTFLQRLVAKLRLPTTTQLTAFHLFHQHLERTKGTFDPYLLPATVVACVFLSGKIEDTTPKIDRVVAASVGLGPLEPMILPVIPAPLGPSGTPRAGGESTNQIQQLSTAEGEVSVGPPEGAVCSREIALEVEQSLLLTCEFNFHFNHPHLVVPQLLESLGVNMRYGKKVYELIRDPTYTHSTLCLEESPRDIALAALVLASKINKFELPADWPIILHTDLNRTMGIVTHMMDCKDAVRKREAVRDAGGVAGLTISQSPSPGRWLNSSPYHTLPHSTGTGSGSHRPRSDPLDRRSVHHSSSQDLDKAPRKHPRSPTWLDNEDSETETIEVPKPPKIPSPPSLPTPPMTVPDDLVHPVVREAVVVKIPLISSTSPSKSSEQPSKQSSVYENFESRQLADASKSIYLQRNNTASVKVELQSQLSLERHQESETTIQNARPPHSIGSSTSDFPQVKSEDWKPPLHPPNPPPPQVTSAYQFPAPVHAVPSVVPSVGTFPFIHSFNNRTDKTAQSFFMEQKPVAAQCSSQFNSISQQLLSSQDLPSTLAISSNHKPALAKALLPPSSEPKNNQPQHLKEHVPLPPFSLSVHQTSQNETKLNVHPGTLQHEASCIQPNSPPFLRPSPSVTLSSVLPPHISLHPCFQEPETNQHPEDPSSNRLNISEQHMLPQVYVSPIPKLIDKQKVLALEDLLPLPEDSSPIGEDEDDSFVELLPDTVVSSDSDEGVGFTCTLPEASLSEKMVPKLFSDQAHNTNNAVSRFSPTAPSPGSDLSDIDALLDSQLEQKPKELPVEILNADSHAKTKDRSDSEISNLSEIEELLESKLNEKSINSTISELSPERSTKGEGGVEEVSKQVLSSEELKEKNILRDVDDIIKKNAFKILGIEQNSPKNAVHSPSNSPEESIKNTKSKEKVLKKEPVQSHSQSRSTSKNRLFNRSQSKSMSPHDHKSRRRRHEYKTQRHKHSKHRHSSPDYNSDKDHFYPDSNLDHNSARHYPDSFQQAEFPLNNRQDLRNYRWRESQDFHYSAHSGIGNRHDLRRDDNRPPERLSKQDRRGQYENDDDNNNHGAPYIFSSTHWNGHNSRSPDSRDRRSEAKNKKHRHKRSKKRRSRSRSRGSRDQDFGTLSRSPRDETRKKSHQTVFSRDSLLQNSSPEMAFNRADPDKKSKKQHPLRPVDIRLCANEKEASSIKQGSPDQFPRVNTSNDWSEPIHNSNVPQMPSSKPKATCSPPPCEAQKPEQPTKLELKMKQSQSLSPEKISKKRKKEKKKSHKHRHDRPKRVELDGTAKIFDPFHESPKNCLQNEFKESLETPTPTISKELISIPPGISDSAQNHYRYLPTPSKDTQRKRERSRDKFEERHDTQNDDDKRRRIVPFQLPSTQTRNQPPEKKKSNSKPAHLGKKKYFKCRLLLQQP